MVNFIHSEEGDKIIWLDSHSHQLQGNEPDFFYFAARLALMSDYSGGIYT